MLETYTEVRTYCKTIIEKIELKAHKANLYYVVCFWKTPFNNIDHRVAYFESVIEASIWFQSTLEKYAKDKCYIVSDIQSLNYDGKLLDEYMNRGE